MPVRITKDAVLKDRMRRAALELIAQAADEVALPSIGIALGERRRGCAHNHINTLVRFGFVAKRMAARPAGTGGGRQLMITITAKGRRALRCLNGANAVTSTSNSMEINAP